MTALADGARPASVVVLNGYSRHNTGDWLLFEETIDFARKRHSGARVIGVALDPASFRDRTTADEILGCPVRPGRLGRGILQALAAIITAGRRGDPSAKAMRSADAAYSVGGGFVQFRSARELVTVGLAHGTQWLLARRMGLPVQMLPQSLGPFGGRASRALARLLLSGLPAIRVRDVVSAERVRELDPRLSSRTQVVPDLVFLHDRTPAPPVVGTGSVAVVVRNWWFPGATDPEARELRYLREIADLVRILRAQGREVDLVVHSDGPTRRGDDRIATKRVAEILGDAIAIRSIADAATPAQAAGTYGEYAAVVSVRMHAALLALREGVPAVAIAYEQKSHEIFSQLGIADWAVSIDSFTAADIAGRLAQPFPTAAVNDRWTALHARLHEILESTA